jgi:S1-C subfamily serine protease
VIDSDGIVLTNAHVVEGALQITVTAESGAAYRGQVLAMEPDLDLAVLKLEDAQGLPTIELADSNALLLGETVIAIGNPLGLGLTVSTGIVSSIEREVELRDGVKQSFIQTDAAINPGNSGGALVDIEGHLIGVNTAIRADAEGIGFAIPVNRARKVAEDLVHYGTVKAPWLGCDVVDIDAHRLRRTALADGAVQVRRVWREGPAEAAGLRPGDLLFEVDGGRERTPGAKLRARWIRDGEVQSGELATTDVPENTAQFGIDEILSVELRPLGAKGLAVVGAGASGSWVQARLRPGDVIVGVDGRAVGSEDDLYAAIRRARAQHRAEVLFTVRRGAYQGHVAVEI